MEDFQFSYTICPIYRQPIVYNKFEHGQNCAKAIGTANIVNTPGVPIISRNCQNELARLSDALCPLSATPLAIQLVKPVKSRAKGILMSKISSFISDQFI